jgi:hypothetical protein
MSQATNPHPTYDDAAHSGRVGLTVVAAAVVAAGMVLTHVSCSGSGWNPSITGPLAMFSGAHWTLVAMLLAAGVTLARTTSLRIAAVAEASLARRTDAAPGVQALRTVRQHAERGRFRAAAGGRTDLYGPHRLDACPATS